MYNLAKLLSEEPEKLERVGILFLKLLVTLLISSILCQVDVSISNFIENPIPKDYSVSKFILFLVTIVIVWFILWTCIAELITEILIFFLSKIGNKKEIFTQVLVVLRVVKKRGNGLGPDENVISFNDLLHTYNEEDKRFITQNRSRIRQYFIMTSVTFATLLFAKDIILPDFMKWVGGIMTFIFLLVSVVFRQFHNYFEDNLDEMKKRFSRLAYMQTIINSLNQNPFIKHHYIIDFRWRKFNLIRKTEIELDWLPDQFTIFPIYHWNETLTKLLLDDGLSRRSKAAFPPDKIGKHYDVVICNIKPNEDNQKCIQTLLGFAYLHCEKDEDIYKNIELLLFKVTKGVYRID